MRRFEHLQKLTTWKKRKLELAVCGQDIAHWVNHHVWTYDPREPATAVPLDLFDVQTRFLLWLEERERLREDGLVEKSRDMGVTWLCVAYALHGWLFRSGYSVGFGSRKLDLVDRKGDPDSVFEKARFLLGNLPEWMRPPGFVLGKHDAYCRIVNPQNESTITGEGGDDIGRGGRKSIYFVDEAAFLERPQLVERSLSATTDVRIDVSTPNGPGNPFAAKRFSGKVPVFTLHYRDDPRKTPEWVAAQKAKTDPVTWAQEREIDYSASVEGICIPAAWVRAAVGLDLPESKNAVAGFDVMEYGRDRNVLVCRRGPVVKIPVDWGPMNTTESTWRMADEAERFGAATVCFDCVGVGAGVRGTLESGGRRCRFLPVAVNTGEAPGEDYWPDGKTSKERFINRRAELWWKLRIRFEKTYEFVTQGKKHPTEELISLPAHPQLVAELSLPLVEYRETGKIQLENKQKMRARGIASPNFADALVLSFASDGADWTFTPDRLQETQSGRIPRDVFAAGMLPTPGDRPAEDFEDDEGEGADWRKYL